MLPSVAYCRKLATNAILRRSTLFSRPAEPAIPGSNPGGSVVRGRNPPNTPSFSFR
ncbi:hypothetical protein [Sulfolobus spindle-shaped virus]|nr:hypothetical protein [Sulfolobus spindle-shaped virus]